jgi:transmembrane sensor
MDDPIASGLLDRFYAGECSAAERASIERWIAADPARPQLVALLRTAWAEAGRSGPPAPQLNAGDMRTAWRAVARRTVEMRAAATIRAPGRILQGSRVPAARALMGIGVVCIAVVFAVMAGVPRHAAARGRTYATAAGQQLSVTLDDGTQLTLAPASRLRIAAGYASGDRTVALDGEALFSVVHDAAHPFAVSTDRAVATDIGTRFDVRAYAADGTTRIAVAQGAVAVAVGMDHDRRLHEPPLRAGDVAVVDTTIAVTHGVDVGALTAWSTGRFVFREGTLRDVAADIARWYDLDVAVDPAIAGRHLVGSLAAASADAALHVVAGALDVRVARVGRRVRILPRT